MIFARRDAAIVDHLPVSNAARAAFTARSTSATVALATSASVAPVAGLISAYEPPSDASTHSLPISRFVRDAGSVAVMSRASDPFKNRRNALPDADAHRCDAEPSAAPA